MLYIFFFDFCSLLNWLDLMIFMIITQNAINTERLLVILAISFNLLLMIITHRHLLFCRWFYIFIRFLTWLSIFLEWLWSSRSIIIRLHSLWIIICSILVLTHVEKSKIFGEALDWFSFIFGSTLCAFNNLLLMVRRGFTRKGCWNAFFTESVSTRDKYTWDIVLWLIGLSTLWALHI